jgi:DNA-binding XRE family transcriptional regulator
MDAKKLKKLKAMGGKIASVQDFLGLTNEDMAVIEARLALAKVIREQREGAGLTQAALAKSLGSSQARVAKMEGGDPQASLDSMVRALAAVSRRVTFTIETQGRVKMAVHTAHAEWVRAARG